MDCTYELKINQYSGEVNFTIPKRVAQELHKGKILVNFCAGPKSRASAWVQFLGPDSDPTVGEDLASAEDSINLERHFEGRETHPMFSLDFSPSEEEEKKEGYRTKSEVAQSYSQELELKDLRDRINQIEVGSAVGTQMRPMSYGEATRVVEQRGLNRHRKHGVLNLHASTSLVRQDFKRSSDQDFQARATFVASKIGSAKAVSRIASSPSTLGNSARSLSEWWGKASCKQRALLLSDSKNLDVSKVDIDRIAKLPCPFREADLSENESD